MHIPKNFLRTKSIQFRSLPPTDCPIGIKVIIYLANHPRQPIPIISIQNDNRQNLSMGSINTPKTTPVISTTFH